MTDHGEDGCFEVFAGIALIAAFAIVRFGWPVSGYVLGLAATSGVLKIVAAAMQPENREATRRERVVIGALKSGGDTALWLAVGCGLVLVLQLGLALLPGVPDATAMADAELYFADALACLRERLSVWTFLALFAVALALAMAVGALWPINLVAQSRRWIGKGISVLGAVSAFSFVGANDLGARYEASAARLRGPGLRSSRRRGDRRTTRSLAQCRDRSVVGSARHLRSCGAKSARRKCGPRRLARCGRRCGFEGLFAAAPRRDRSDRRCLDRGTQD